MTAKYFCLLLLTTLAFSTIPWPAGADLRPYIRKYQTASISRKSLQRLDKYDQLIRYFTSFSYFRPRYRVNADFVRALILAESGADPEAVSSRHAIGLGQIILSTGQQAARELYQSPIIFNYVDKERLRNLSRDDLLDPATNILLTCYIISKYNHKFDGRLELVLSAWNAGENVHSLAEGEYAPYTETKDLIGKVNGYYLYLLRQKGALHYR